MSELTRPQVDVLLRAIRPGRVVHRDGQSNLEAYDVRAHLTRIFGFGRWSEIAVHTEMLYEQETETKQGKPAYKVAYRADRALQIFDVNGEMLCEHHGSAVGEGIMPDFKRGDAHDFALKKAQSQALKRAAINLGDQFGLSLYAKGSLGAVVGKVVGAENQEMHEPDVVEETDPDATVDRDKVEVQAYLPLSDDALAQFQKACADVELEPDAVYERAFPDGRPDPLTDEHLPAMRDAYKALIMEDAAGKLTDEDHDVVDAEVVDDSLPTEQDMPPAGDERPSSRAQVGKIKGEYHRLGINERDAQLETTAEIVGHPVETHNHLTRDEAARVIEALTEIPDAVTVAG